MKHRITIFAVAVCLFLGYTAKAQFPYTVNTSKIAYTPLFGGQVLSNSNAWEDTVFIINMPFAFKLGERSINTLYMDASGVMLGDTTTTNGIILISAELIDRGIADSAQASLSPVFMKVDGAVGNRILKIEMANAGLADEYYDSNTCHNYVNVQLWLYEQSNIFELRYGSSFVDDVPNYFSSLGVTGGMFKNINYGMGTFDAAYLLTGNPANASLDSLTLTRSMAGFSSLPDSGTVYRFTPVQPTTSIGNYTSLTNKYKVYPTRCTNVLFVDNNTNDEATFIITSMSGRVVRIGDLAAPHSQVNVRDLPVGMYVMKIQNKDSFEVQKFVVSH